MIDLLQKQADLIDKILEYTEELQAIIEDLKKSLEEYEDDLQKILEKL